MKVDKAIVDFINKIVIKSKDEKELVNNLQVYKDYLVLTEIYEEEVMNFVDKMISQSKDVINIKNTFGSFDVNGIIEKEKNVKQKENIKKTKVKEKHYSHYISEDNYSHSTSCGVSSNSYSGCTPYTPTYGSSCGGGSTYRSSC